MNTFLLGFGCFYAVAKKPFDIPQIKHVLEKNGNCRVLVKLLSIILAVVLAASVGLLLLPFGIFKFFVYCYLRKRHGSYFGGFLSGVSAAFLVEKEQMITNNVLFVEYDGDSTDFQEKLKVAVRKTHEHFYHLRCTVNRYFGYYYLLKDQVVQEEVFKIISLNAKEKDVLELHDVLDYLDGIKISEEKTLWETVLFEQPVWLNGKNTYAIYCRINHSIAGGFATASILLKYIAKTDNSTKNGLKKIIDLKKYQGSFTLDHCYINKSPINLHYDKLAENRNQFTVHYVEDQPEKPGKIRFISKKIDIGYGDVVMAGILYGMSSLLDKKNIKFSGKFQLAITVSFEVKNIENILAGKSTDDSLSNNFFYNMVTVSKYEKNCSKSAFLNEIAEQCRRVRKSMDPWMTYFMINHVMAIVPVTLHQKLSRNLNRNISLIFTNMAVHGKKTVCGRDLAAFLACITTTNNKSMYAFTMCYDDRFVITITGRYDFLKSRKDSQYVLDKTLEYIEDVYEELIRETP